MTNAIATQLAAILDSPKEFIELDQAEHYWQQKISQAIVEASSPIPSSTIYLVFPSTTDVLAKVVKLASQQQWRILICGNGSKLNWGNPSKNIQLVVSTQKCDRLIEHAIGDLTVTVEAGMKLVDLQNQLRAHNQFLPIDPSYPETATLGGIVATADAGSWRQRYGGVRDLLLGLSFIRADGQVAKAGGRVVKNVAGYDLMKLFTGAYGTLGIISQLTFRTYPLIKTSQALLLTGAAAAIAEACQGIRSSGLTPTVLDLLSPGLIKQLKLKQNTGLLMRWQTIPESIEQQLQQTKAIAQSLNLTAQNYQAEAEIDLWHSCATLTTQPDAEATVICKVGMVPTAVVGFLEQFDNKIVASIHASSGIGILKLEADPQMISALRSHCQQHSGFLTLLDAPRSVKQDLDVWGYTGNALQTMKNIKNQFDPNHILNPERFVV